MDAAAARAAMVDRQLRGGGIRDERVLAAMLEVPRDAFVPERIRDRAYEDGALPIGHGQTVSQPWVVAAICEGLELAGDEEVLEVGTGSGYSTAILALLARHVRSIEIVDELAERAAATLAELGYSNVEVLAGDGSGEVAGPQSVDAIAVHAAAPALPGGLVRALRPGGRLVIPIAEGGADLLVAFRRTDDGSGDEPELRRKAIAPCRFVPLIGEGGFPAR
jgi:protein-L-isoaspartate(D-aspartate) O-methyltransferase